MRRIERAALSSEIADGLRRYQAQVDEQSALEAFNSTPFWDNRRQSQAIQGVLTVLRQMAGELYRCMYCVNSEAADIEHFWPKSPYHNRMFVWENLLLCCTICGRMKGNEFPLGDGEPLLIDPSSENPWDFLDFDPDTGNIVPRIDPASGEELPKGRETVRILQLDRREAVARGYKKTYRRLGELADELFESDCPEESADRLLEADDHGLLGWCFGSLGRSEAPFRNLREHCPDLWRNVEGHFA
jgi:uncharacterized protein (TIGR02646 family)